MSRRDALGFDAEVKARRFKGEVIPRPGKMTLAGAYAGWKTGRGRFKSPATRRTYEAVWKAHVKEKFDQLRLSDLVADPELLEFKIAELEDADVSKATQRKVLTVISTALHRAVDNNRISFNPALRVEWPKPTAARLARPLAPIAVERIRTAILDRATKDRTGMRAVGDACIVSVLAYAGLRPAEALALNFNDVEGNVIAVDKALKWEEKGRPEGTTKTDEMREPPLLAPVAADLDEWRNIRGLPSAGELVFAGQGGVPWSRSAWNNWRARVWKPAVAAVARAHPDLAAFDSARPYDLRGSFVSLQLRGGKGPMEVANWAGHSPAVMFRYYARVIRELEYQDRMPAADQILRARELLDKPDSEVTDLMVQAQKPVPPPRQLKPGQRRALKLMFGPR